MAPPWHGALRGADLAVVSFPGRRGRGLPDMRVALPRLELGFLSDGADALQAVSVPDDGDLPHHCSPPPVRLTCPRWRG